MRKLNVAYIGNCSEEFSAVMDRFYGERSTVACVCDTDIKRGLICVEKYLCNFVEDYHEILSRPDMNLVVVESCGQLRRLVIAEAAEAGKNLFVILDEETLMQVDQLAESVQQAQAEQGIRAIFVTVDELDNDFWSNLPISREDIGPILNVTIGLPSRVPGSVSLERNAYDAVRTLYELLGAPVTCLGMQGRVTEDVFTSAASYRYANGALACISIGGGARAHTVRIYGEKGCAMIGRNKIRYRLADQSWVTEEIVPQKRRTRRPTVQLLETILSGEPLGDGHSLQEVLVTSWMLRAILRPDSQEEE